MLRDQIRAKIYRITESSELEQLALEIKNIYRDNKSPVRAELLSILNSRRSDIKPSAVKWHKAPDGSDCCCTAEDRRYGMGCR